MSPWTWHDKMQYWQHLVQQLHSEVNRLFAHQPPIPLTHHGTEPRPSTLSLGSIQYSTVPIGAEFRDRGRPWLRLSPFASFGISTFSVACKDLSTFSSPYFENHRTRSRNMEIQSMVSSTALHRTILEFWNRANSPPRKFSPAMLFSAQKTRSGTAWCEDHDKTEICYLAIMEPPSWISSIPLVITSHLSYTQR